MLAVLLLVAATGTAAAHGNGSYGGGGMMGGGWGLFGGAMGLWGLLWMGLTIAVPLYLVYSLLDSGSETVKRILPSASQPLPVAWFRRTLKQPCVV
ncbi:hypothetical protein [Haloplanus pelagicus]|jgi:putative membrane protein|uniref:hypothetical protein n=1 Tax=Haloplanus pelagicus TaxID=2949995 RepID=UPI00203AA2BF|nr:hypothetical protein [Haloplanus sp. HW8-1]